MSFYLEKVIFSLILDISLKKSLNREGLRNTNRGHVAYFCILPYLSLFLSSFSLAASDTGHSSLETTVRKKTNRNGVCFSFFFFFDYRFEGEMQRHTLMKLCLYMIVSVSIIVLTYENKNEKVKVLVAKPCLMLFKPMECSPPRLLCPWNSLGKNTGVGYYALLHFAHLYII